MKKAFLNIGLLLAISFAAASFSSCSSRKAHVIRAENVHGSTSLVKSVRIVREIEPTPTGSRIHALALALFENNGFRINLPQTMPDSWLFPLDEFIEEAEGFTISDKDAKVYILFRELTGCTSTKRTYGDFRLKVNDDHFRIEIMWIYTDRNVSIESENDEEKISLNLKRGWNKVYLIDERVDETYFFVMTTQRPTDANFQWYFLTRSDGRFVYPNEMEPKSLRNIKSRFAR